MQPGFRFYPTEEELVSFYLHHKLEGKREEMNQVIPVVNIYELDPWHLPKLSGEKCSGDTEQWFFFVPIQEREARGGRPNRTTRSGYWKATGSPSYVYSSGNRVIGLKKTMVFYKGKTPTGKKTKWKMNEYRAIEADANHSSGSGGVVPKLRHEMSLCRVYVISGSFRAFDRRPLGIENGGKLMYQQANVGYGLQHVPEINVEMEEHFDPFVNAGSSNLETDNNCLESLWDSEQLHWPQWD